jgi:hypothetical protein
MVHSVPISKWPTPDRQAGEKACRPNVRLRRGGSAAHLKPVTQADLASRFGFYLDFLIRQEKFKGDETALQSIKPGLVNDYIKELRARVGSVTLHGMIYKLRRAAELIDPDLKLLWLKTLSPLHMAV